MYVADCKCKDDFMCPQCREYYIGIDVHWEQLVREEC